SSNGCSTTAGPLSTGTWTQVIIVEMPVERGPAVVEQPLDDAGGVAIFVLAVSLIHRAVSVVRCHLRLENVFLQSLRRAIAVFHSLIEEGKGEEGAAAAMELPELI